MIWCEIDVEVNNVLRKRLFITSIINITSIIYTLLLLLEKCKKRLYCKILLHFAKDSHFFFKQKQ